MCGWRRLQTVMDATTNQVNDADLELDRELETWNWARAAGVSAEELRVALQASSITPELLKAA